MICVPVLCKPNPMLDVSHCKYCDRAVCYSIQRVVWAVKSRTYATQTIQPTMLVHCITDVQNYG